MTTLPTAPAMRPYTVEDYLTEWQTNIDTIADAHTRHTLAVYAAWQAGQIGTGLWAANLAATVMQLVGDGFGAGAGLAARFLWFTRGIDPYDPDNPVTVNTIGLDLDAEVERVTTAAQTLAGELDHPTNNTPMPTRLERLILNETANNMTRGATTATAVVHLDGYTRGLEPDACELCTWLHKNGHIYPIDKPMHRHPGCRCAPIPTTRKETR